MSKRKWIYKNGKKKDSVIKKEIPPAYASTAAGNFPERRKRPEDPKGLDSISVSLDFKTLGLRCYQSMSEITKDALCMGGVKTHCLDGEWFVHIQRGSKVLVVAHMDNIRPATHFARTKEIIGGGASSFDRLYCETLDDRLGVYTALDLLPKLGLVVDVLLTTGEETGKTSARSFIPKEEYNWIVEFDRRGEDVVLYDFDGNKKWDEALEKSGYDLGFGSFSDICEMEDLGICAFNMGIGFCNEHSPDAYMVPSEYLRQMQRFVHFFRNNKDILYSHTKRIHPVYSGYNAYSMNRRKDDYYDDFNWGHREDIPTIPVVQKAEAVGKYATCDYCSVTLDREEMIWTSENGWLCTSCYSAYYRGEMIVCPNCSNEMEKDELLYRGGHWECPDCLAQLVEEDRAVGVTERKQTEGTDVPASKERVEAWRNSMDG